MKHGLEKDTLEKSLVKAGNFHAGKSIHKQKRIKLSRFKTSRRVEGGTAQNGNDPSLEKSGSLDSFAMSDEYMITHLVPASTHKQPCRKNTIVRFPIVSDVDSWWIGRKYRLSLLKDPAGHEAYAPTDIIPQIFC
ncbi:hypothetical protein AVEN_155097-1 [Araneus ventricosus]|uniref:Uncharacterized protein n=1 Tax=Araneus ventricosus TaxID=182803 RepID=A0A4Y2A8V5_ARAVE|nr:hypothetical protein AVEN_155097-1 [Araneus ventricosus]